MSAGQAFCYTSHNHHSAELKNAILICVGNYCGLPLNLSQVATNIYFPQCIGKTWPGI